MLVNPSQNTGGVIALRTQMPPRRPGAASAIEGLLCCHGPVWVPPLMLRRAATTIPAASSAVSPASHGASAGDSLAAVCTT